MARDLIEVQCRGLGRGWAIVSYGRENWRLGWPTRGCGLLGLLGVRAKRVLRCSACGAKVPSESHPVLRPAQMGRT